MKKIALITLCLAVAGCTELSSLNTAVGNFAGSINKTLGVGTSSVQTADDSYTSARDIDTLYVRIKREFGFKSDEETKQGCSDYISNCNYRDLSIKQHGHLHERQPGIYYHMAGSFGGCDKYGKGCDFLDVKLEKEGRKTLVSWSVQSKDTSFVADINKRMLKAIK